MEVASFGLFGYDEGTSFTICTCNPQPKTSSSALTFPQSHCENDTMILFLFLTCGIRVAINLICVSIGLRPLVEQFLPLHTSNGFIYKQTYFEAVHGPVTSI